MRNTLLMLLLISCSKVAWGESVVFSYDDFGPQVFAYQTIGFQWYQWDNHGSGDPHEKCDIKVVVFWDEPISSIKNKYPVDSKMKQDYRYLSYREAIRYLDSTLAEFPDADNLANTKNKLLKYMGNKTE